jgi:methionine sulfoxide reductase heme-binding subunit
VTIEVPYLWLINRASGLVLVVLLTITVVLGILASQARAGGRVPGFFSQTLHRQVSLATVGLLLLHITTPVIDEFVDIRWWHVFTPFGGIYKPLWLGLGAIAFDLLVLTIITSLLRTWIEPTVWKGLHLTSYLIWPVAVIHGLGIGTDDPFTEGWSAFLYLSCTALVVCALGYRVINRNPRRDATELL